MQSPQSVEELSEIVKSERAVRVRGGGTKSAMSGQANVSLDRMSGVLEYDPSEFTFTARGGTPVKEVEALLAASGQFLPFDPVWVDAGSTLGGTIASGLSGSGRFRYGGVRDFILGVEFVSGDGEVHAGGGKVVKNAAGFDFPKLLVGSRGSMGIITSVTFKVFPRPKRFATLRVGVNGPADAVGLIQSLARSALELTCLDYVPFGEVWLRFGGLEESLARRIERTQSAVGRESEVYLGEAEETIWRTAREFSWLGEGRTLLKIPTQTRDMTTIESSLESLSHLGLERRYGVGGNVCWLAWPSDRGPSELLPILAKIDRRALAIRGEPWGVLGPARDVEFGRRLATVLDPAGKLAWK
jgi:glycolate oxidase FAD binding subunit